MADRKICIFGTGGFGREVLCCLIDSLAATEGDKRAISDIAVFMEGDQYYSKSEIMGIPVIRQSEFDPGAYEVVVAVGDPQTRKKIVESLPEETKFAKIIHPSAVISEWVEIGEGSIVTAGTILTCNIKVGKHAHFNLHTTVGHDCTIGDYLTTTPGVNISGNCTIGDFVYFGTNSSVRQGVNICSNVTIGMGGVVVKSIDRPGTYIGNPVRLLEK